MTMVDTQLEVIDYSITVKVYMHKPIEIVKGRDAYQWINTFLDLREEEQNPIYKKNYERCQVLLKLLGYCWGYIEDVKNGPNSVIFTFSFDSIAGLSTFARNLEQNIEKGVNEGVITISRKE